MAEKLASFIREEFKRRWEEKENKREKEDAPGFWSGGEGGWNRDYEKFSDEITKGIAGIVKNEKEAEIVLDHIFNEIEFKYSGGGDHHEGYWNRCDADTTKARKLLNNPSKLHEIINKTYDVKT